MATASNRAQARMASLSFTLSGLRWADVEARTQAAMSKSLAAMATTEARRLAGWKAGYWQVFGGTFDCAAPCRTTHLTSKNRVLDYFWLRVVDVFA
jgi:hypothetical protein